MDQPFDQPLTHDEFATLSPGDVLLIKAGCPNYDEGGELAEDTEVTVAAVDGFSFLTTEGDGYGACWAQGHVYPTGRTGAVVLSEKAQRILKKVGLDD